MADRFQELSRPGGALSPSSLAAGFGQATEALGPMMAAESARWGTQYGLPFLTPTDWQTAVGNVRLNYLPKRTLTMSAELATWLAQQKDASHRNPSPEEMASRPKPKPPAMGGFPQANWPLLDSDGDGLPDYWERLMGLDPFNAADAMADADLDGRKNIEEFLARSSARRPDARPALAEDRPGLHNSFIQPSRRRVLPAAR